MPADARRVLRPAGAFGVMVPRLMCTMRGENVIPVIAIQRDEAELACAAVPGVTGVDVMISLRPGITRVIDHIAVMN